jgi:hypothetical protein
MNKLEAIDEAVNLLMDYHLRPHFLIEDTETDIDDEIYSYLHKEVRSLIILTMVDFNKYEALKRLGTPTTL